MRLGAHLSIGKGLVRAINDAKEIGANCLQIFSSPPRNWKKPRFREKEIKEFLRRSREEDIFPIFVHGKYLINISSANAKIREKSMKSLIDDLVFAGKIKASGVIFHPRIKNFNFLIKTIKQVLSKTPKNTFLILENSANLGIKDVAKIFNRTKRKRLKFCFDLAHAFQSGYDLRKSEVMEKIFKFIRKEIGTENLALIHANDSKTESGSHHDLHENIGKGKIGKEPFFLFLNHPVSSKIPFIIETPGFREKGLKADKENLNILKKLVGTKLNRLFFEQKTIEIAKKLLGKYLILNKKGKIKIVKILETEAYVGPHDKASHAFLGKTKRNKMMWGPPGSIYIYLIYGIWHCLNIVTEKEGFPAAVLIRRVKPIFGIKEKISGPGKLCKVLGITKRYNGLNIAMSDEIYIKDIGEKPKRIYSAPRIGVEYAGEWARKKLRFYI